MKYKYFFFDLDGTLIDSYNHTSQCFIKAIKKYRGITLNLQEVYEHFKISFGDAYNAFKPSKDEWDYFSSLHNNIKEEPVATLYPEIPHLLKTIKDHGGSIYLYTNRDALCFEYLKYFNIDSYFSGAIYQDGKTKYKPDPEPLNEFIAKNGLNKSECLVIGDRSIDVEGAYNAKIDSVLFDEFSSIFLHHATYVITRLNQIYYYLDLDDMLFANYHTHTIRCGHAIGSDEEYINEAIKNGYSTLGFSEHFNERNIPLMDEYVSTLSLLREKYKNHLEILIGFEAENKSHSLELLKKYYDNNEIDYLVNGNHEFINPDGHVSSYYDSYDFNIGTKALLDNIKKCHKTGMFNVLAHPDLFLYSYKKWNEKCAKVAHKIGKYCKDNNIVVEINVNGIIIRNRLKEKGLDEPGYTYYEFFKILKEYDIKFIIGVDAHNPKQLSEKAINQAIEFAHNLGLNIINKLEVHNG